MSDDVAGLVHPAALVSPGALLAPGVNVGPFAVVEDGAVLGSGCEVRAHAVVSGAARLGARVRVHESAVVGGTPQDLSFRGGATRVEIGDDTVLREGVTVHRATKADGATVIGARCFVMAYAHVAHDDVIGDDVIIANNVALAGHVSIGERAFVGGCVGVHQFCRIGRLAMIGGHSKVVQDCLPFVITDGVPARARGLNVVGLRRAGFSSTQLRTLKEGYRLLVRAGLGRDEALDRLGALADPLADELAAFVRGSRRGFAHAVSG